MNTRKQCWFWLVCLFVFPSFSSAQPLRIDLDVRRDSTAAGFESWRPEEGFQRSFGNVKISFELLEPPADTKLAISWHNKDGLKGYKLAMDCLYAQKEDGKNAHPSFAGGTIRITLEGLSPGRHTLLTYHNAPWPAERFGKTISPCRIRLNGQTVRTVQPTQAAADDRLITTAFFEFTAEDGKPVMMDLEPTGKPEEQICTAVLNGFEIDRPYAPGSIPDNPTPADGDFHVFAHNDHPGPGSAGKGHTELKWSAAQGAAFYDVYLGTDRSSIEKASLSDAEIYKGRLPAGQTAFSAENLHSKYTYFWRVDAVSEDGTIRKGSVWSFRVRRLAFPSAEGYGRFARAGRGGRVIAVTTLDDYDPQAGEPVIDGSLRKALEVEKGARVVIFRVGGTIFLKNTLTIPPDGGDVYVAGQTAPGDGICLARYSFGMNNTTDAVIRFIRTRIGDYAKKPLDGMGMAGCDHCIIDHCSISWSLDEGISTRGAKNITFSRNIVSEALHNSYHYGKHSFAGSISGNIGSYHHNLLVHCAGRNWSLAGGLGQDGQYEGFCDIRNNIIYNWLHRTTDGGVYRCNFVNNLYLPGPATKHFLLMRPDGDQMKTGNPQKFYLTGNKMEGYPQYDADNWKGVSPNYAQEADIRSNEPFFPSYVTTYSAEELLEKVLDDVGAVRPKRDALDERIVREVRQRSFTYRGSKDGLPGIIDSQDDVGGYPTLKGGPAAPDSDGDGLPDWWEVIHHLNPHSPAGDFSDSNADPDNDGFSCLEEYLEYLARGGDPFGKIDRQALVSRHNVRMDRFHEFSPLSVGNGRFAFTADITGLQTFPQAYAKGIPLTTMAEWGWHSFPNTAGCKLEDTFVQIDTYGRLVPYNSNQRGPAADYLRANPHQITLGLIGLVLQKADGSPVSLEEIQNIEQTLNLWESLLDSTFTIEGLPVHVQTCVHPEQNILAFRIDSPLLESERLRIQIRFPYAAGTWGTDPADWNSPDKHTTILKKENDKQFRFERVMDSKRYVCTTLLSGGGDWQKTAEHHYLWQPKHSGGPLEGLVLFQEQDGPVLLTDFDTVRAAVRRHWKTFWETGGAIDLSLSKDPRWKELERRIVLSQYLTAIQSVQKYPPQETGLTCNSWFGKFHLEMHWWHSVHFALWNRLPMLEAALNWYQEILPAARAIARRQGYEGVRWPKMTSPDGQDSPSGIGPLLIWQQPHPIYYAELVYRQKPNADTLNKFKEIVFETARFMADFAHWDEKQKRYVLGPPVIPAQENYKYADTWNPTFELCYWYWGLNTAQQWRQRLGLPREEKWDHVMNHLSALPVRDGIYTAVEPEPYTNLTDHPSMLAAMGVLPKTPLVNEDTMRRTAQWVYAEWQWPDTWGWDYPMLAMTAARVGLPELALDAFFIESKKNLYWPNGHNYQRENLPLYLPGNGGLLTATAMMAAGWDGAPKHHAPGFPNNGLWVVRWENLLPMP